MIFHLASYSQFICFKGNRGILLVPCLFTSLILFGGLVVCISLYYSEAYAQSNTWYVGRGLQPDTYYTYKIQEHDTNQGRSFLMTIYFREFDNDRNYWIAPFL